jgi:hypothetical protein
MADSAVVHIGENSPEQVAYKLLLHMASIDGFTLQGLGDRPTKEWLIKNYSTCLSAVQNPGNPQYALELLE